MKQLPHVPKSIILHTFSDTALELDTAWHSTQETTDLVELIGVLPEIDLFCGQKQSTEKSIWVRSRNCAVLLSDFAINW